MEENEGPPDAFQEGDGKDTADNFNKAILLMARIKGKIPWAHEMKISETDLPLERQRQAELYIKLGFHTEIDPSMTPQEYIDSLPQFEPLPKNKENRFIIPLLIEPRISTQRQAELAGLIYNNNANTGAPGIAIKAEFIDWNDPEGYTTPTKPYMTWGKLGKPDQSIQKTRKTLLKSERAGTIHEGIALFIVHREVFINHGITMPGTDLKGSGLERAAAITYILHQPELFGEYIGNSSTQFRALTCARI